MKSSARGSRHAAGQPQAVLSGCGMQTSAAPTARQAAHTMQAAQRALEDEVALGASGTVPLRGLAVVHTSGSLGLLRVDEIHVRLHGLAVL